MEFGRDVDLTEAETCCFSNVLVGDPRAAVKRHGDTHFLRQSLNEGPVKRNGEPPAPVAVANRRCQHVDARCLDEARGFIRVGGLALAAAAERPQGPLRRDPGSVGQCHHLRGLLHVLLKGLVRPVEHDGSETGVDRRSDVGVVTPMVELERCRHARLRSQPADERGQGVETEGFRRTGPGNEQRHGVPLSTDLEDRADEIGVSTTRIERGHAGVPGLSHGQHVAQADERLLTHRGCSFSKDVGERQ